MTNAKRRWIKLLFVMLAVGACALVGPVPPAAQAAPSSGVPLASGWEASIGEDIRRQEYQIAWQESAAPDGRVQGVYQAPNRAHNLRTTFGPEGIRVVPRREQAPFSWQWGLSLVGCGGAGSGAGSGADGAYAALPAAQMAVDGNRIEYERVWASGQRLVEWYVNDERGLEQGFTLSAPPPFASADPSSQIVFDLALSGDLTPHLIEGASPGRGAAIVFVTSDGVRVLRYSDLYAYDAIHRPLPAQMHLVDLDPGAALAPGIRIRVDAAGARYPIVVDPLSSSPNWWAESNQEGAHLGIAVSHAGDVNGDGYGDVIAGAHNFDAGQTDEGRAFVYYGSASGLRVTGGWTAEGNQSGAQFGRAVGTAGDVNGDGYDDVVVGAIFYDAGQMDEGRVFLYLGSASGLPGAPDWTVDGNQADARLGISVGTAGDVNGDGYDEVVVGTHMYDAAAVDTGRVYVYYGSSTGPGSSANRTIQTNQAGARMGIAVGTAGDVNGDGYDDLIVGADRFDSDQTNEGRAFVYHGSPDGLGVQAWVTESNQADAYYGSAVSTAGDVNDDGYDDVIVGAYLYDGTYAAGGRVYLYLGSAGGLSSTAAWTADGESARAFLGRSVGTAGDVNGDGYDDVVVGADGQDGIQQDAGRAYVYYGSADGLIAPDWVDEGDVAGAKFGCAVDTAGDVNGDGYDDVLIGASDYSAGQTDEGRVFVYYGAGSDVPPPTANFSASPRSGPAPLTVQFTDQSTGQISEWLWDLGDGSTSTVRNPRHSYANPGTYAVALRVSGPGGSDTETKSGYIRVETAPPVANFSGSPRSGPAPLTVYLIDQSTGEIDDWSWSFGDGGTSIAQHPSHTYANPGTYAVSLTVSGPGGQDTETKNGYISVGTASPVANFSGSPRSGPAPLTVQFTDQSTGQISDWLWNFGDGSTSTAQDPSHTYDEPGTYAVSLTVSGPGGQNTETRNDYVGVETVSPVAGFSASPRSGAVPLAVQFTDRSTGEISARLWNFGDGSTSTAQNPSHTYDKAGTYGVSLTVSGPGGQDTETTAGYIQVSAPSKVYLPGTFYRWSGMYAYPCDARNGYCEENDSLAKSYGPLGWNWPYAAYPDDKDDYYYFELDAPQTATIRLTNFKATGDLVLYELTPAGQPRLIVYWGQGGDAMEIQAALEPGTYYVRVYAEGNHSPTDLYTLRVGD